MALTRRTFLERLAGTAGATVTYEAMTALGLLAVPVSPATAFELRGQAGGAEVLILGAGLAGMTVAYELGKLGYTTTILEARMRPGGRCHTVRRGTVSEEQGSTETAAFDEGVYFNPGPMRIPHHHKSTLGYCKELGVPIEVFTDDNQNAYFYKSGVAPAAGRKFRRREVENDLSGYTSELLAKALSQPALNAPLTKADRDALIEYLRREGALGELSKYGGSPRRGYKTPPGAGDAPGEPSAAIPLHDLLESKTGFYIQPEYLHNAPMFQIVGGTDRLATAMAERLKDRIIFGAVVKEIHQTADGVSVVYEAEGQMKKATARFGVCTIPLPVLAAIPVTDFDPAIETGIKSVGYAAVGKIGLQFKRRFWEEDDQIFGGMSRTDQDIAQIIYPSAGYLGTKGLLVGYYQAGAPALKTGVMGPAERQALALAQGAVIHPQYPEAFEKGFSVSWQQVRWNKGGWAGWSTTGRKTTYATMLKGDRNFYFAGEHMSYLVGWMAGALESGQQVASAIHARAGSDVTRTASVA